jgi:hypothetical protein
MEIAQDCGYKMGGVYGPALTDFLLDPELLLEPLPSAPIPLPNNSIVAHVTRSQALYPAELWARP